jgi:SAM-dependent methyltransferase
MFRGNIEHYFQCGVSALSIMQNVIGLAGLQPTTILDYGAGAGRVTRWLEAAFPDAEIHACDVQKEAVDFLRSTFNVKAWCVEADPSSLSFPSLYDVIWVGSVVTHLPEVHTRGLVSRLLKACRPNGILLLSFHGRAAFNRQESGEFSYIDDVSWARIKTEYLATGYGYADYPGFQEYGISVFSLAWACRLVGEHRLFLLGEQLWDNHHDIIAIQNRYPIFR